MAKFCDINPKIEPHFSPFRHNAEEYMPGFEWPRAIAAMLHVAWLGVSYLGMFGGLYEVYLPRVGFPWPVVALSDERMKLYFALDIFYSVRWAFGVLTMQSRAPPELMIVFMGIFKYFLHQVTDRQTDRQRPRHQGGRSK